MKIHRNIDHLQNASLSHHYGCAVWDPTWQKNVYYLATPCKVLYTRRSVTSTTHPTSPPFSSVAITWWATPNIGGKPFYKVPHEADMLGSSQSVPAECLETHEEFYALTRSSPWHAAVSPWAKIKIDKHAKNKQIGMQGILRKLARSCCLGYYNLPNTTNTCAFLARKLHRPALQGKGQWKNEQKKQFPFLVSTLCKGLQRAKGCAKWSQWLR